MRLVVVLLALLAPLAGCGTSDDRDQARTVVERFYGAIRDDRPEEACAQLSAAAVEQLESQTQQPCSGVITRLEPSGWKVTAFGCKAADGKPRDRPYECELEV